MRQFSLRAKEVKYQWAARFERASLLLTEEGEVETYQTVKKEGEIEERGSGQVVVNAILEETKKIGNLIHLEVIRID